jgi:hypothetical protein
MSVTSIGGSGNQFLSLASESLPEGSFTSVSGELAVLMLSSQEQQKQAQHAALESARQDFKDGLAQEVDALRHEADAAFRGACFEGGTAIVSGGLGVWGAARECDKPWQTPASDGCGRLAHPLGTLVGTNYGAADAKSAEGAQEAAKWQVNDARDAINDASQLQNKALDWASSMSDRDAATTTAILSNKV